MAEGYASAEDIDRTVRDGLGLRWAFMGPFETIDLNASGGLSHYVEIFGDLYHEMIKERGAPRRWDPALVERVNGEMRARWSLEDVPKRQARRDSGLMENDFTGWEDTLLRQELSDTNELSPTTLSEDDIANLVCYLVSPLARYITGTVIPVDGGLRRYQF